LTFFVGKRIIKPEKEKRRARDGSKNNRRGRKGDERKKEVYAV